MFDSRASVSCFADLTVLTRSC